MKTKILMVIGAVLIVVGLSIYAYEAVCMVFCTEAPKDVPAWEYHPKSEAPKPIHVPTANEEFHV